MQIRPWFGGAGPSSRPEKAVQVGDEIAAPMLAASGDRGERLARRVRSAAALCRAWNAPRWAYDQALRYGVGGDLHGKQPAPGGWPRLIWEKLIEAGDERMLSPEGRQQYDAFARAAGVA